MLKIGEVAARSGLSVDALRYYERIGLLPKPARTPSGYRLYEAHVVDRLAFIKRAQRFGFTLEEIRQIVRLGSADPQTCSHVLDLIARKLEELDHRYREILRLRRELSAYKTACERALARRQSCPLIEELVHPSGSVGGDARRRKK